MTSDDHTGDLFANLTEADAPVSHRGDLVTTPDPPPCVLCDGLTRWADGDFECPKCSAPLPKTKKRRKP